MPNIKLGEIFPTPQTMHTHLHKMHMREMVPNPNEGQQRTYCDKKQKINKNYLNMYT